MEPDGESSDSEFWLRRGDFGERGALRPLCPDEGPGSGRLELSNMG